MCVCNVYAPLSSFLIFIKYTELPPSHEAIDLQFYDLLNFFFLLIFSKHNLRTITNSTKC